MTNLRSEYKVLADVEPHSETGLQRRLFAHHYIMKERAEEAIPSDAAAKDLMRAVADIAYALARGIAK